MLPFSKILWLALACEKLNLIRTDLTIWISSVLAKISLGPVVTYPITIGVWRPLLPFQLFLSSLNGIYRSTIKAQYHSLKCRSDYIFRASFSFKCPFRCLHLHFMFGLLLLQERECSLSY